MKGRALAALLLWVAVMLLIVFRALLSDTYEVSDASWVGSPSSTHRPNREPSITHSSIAAENVLGKDERSSSSKASLLVPTVVPNLLSLSSRRGELREKVLRICKTHCAPKTGSGLPSICSGESLPLSPRWESSKTVETAARAPPSETLWTTVILCSVGTRFFGPGGQSYVLEAIPQWRLFNPPETSTVFLILHQQVMEDTRVKAMAAKYSVELVDEASLDSSLAQQYRQVFYIQGFMHPGGSRKTGHQNFNQYVSERFYYLASLMQQRNLSHVLHFENDIMVYDDMRKHVHAAKLCGAALASTIIDSKGFIPGALYIRDAASIQRFCVFLNELLGCGENFGRALTRRWKDYANDMTYLLNFYHLFGTDALTILPGWEHSPEENCIFDVTQTLARENEVEKLGDNEKEKQHDKRSGRKFLYDVASFGQWYSFAANSSSGMPPRHVAESMRKGRFLDATPPPLMTWQKDAQGRRQPFWKGYQLVSLHIHAKNLNKFRSRDWDP
jgi:hypothetical protein